MIKQKNNNGNIFILKQYKMKYQAINWKQKYSTAAFIRSTSSTNECWGSPTYCQTNCSLNIFTNNMTIGQYELLVTVYPNVTGFLVDLDFGASWKDIFKVAETESDFLKCSGEEENLACWCKKVAIGENVSIYVLCTDNASRNTDDSEWTCHSLHQCSYVPAIFWAHSACDICTAKIAVVTLALPGLLFFVPFVLPSSFSW
ncbi:unnamed protein product [Lymnaea stagnalis]|uniref:Uncharacterized protein n=1 Tax=Lymnaea stagnalis TaxID=6523 RepID=A0AAV2HV54_LYMST